MGYLPEKKTVSQFDLKGRFARQYLSFAGKSSKHRCTRGTNKIK